MTNHSAVYFIAAESYNDLKAIRNAGIIDTHLVVHGGGVTPSQQFVTDCNNAGTSPILNNGNDGVAGWNGSDSYNANLAAMGIHGVGGESEQAPEIDSIMNNLIFVDYGGQGTGGGTNNDIWNVTHPGNVHGHGAVGYYETYDASTNLWRWPTLGSGMIHAKDHGVKEIGLMVGNWMINHSTAQDYVDIANQMEANGITFAGIGIWAGYGSNMNGLLNQFASWYQLWQSIWPPEMTTMKNRFTQPKPPEPVGKEAQLNMWVVDQQVDVSVDVAMGGRLKDADGTPIAGQNVEVMHYVNYDTGRTLVQDGEKTTDDKGEVWYWFHGTRHYVLSYYLHFKAANGYKERWAGPLDIYVHQPRS